MRLLYLREQFLGNCRPGCGPGFLWAHWVSISMASHHSFVRVRARKHVRRDYCMLTVSEPESKMPRKIQKVSETAVSFKKGNSHLRVFWPWIFFFPFAVISLLTWEHRARASVCVCVRGCVCVCVGRGGVFTSHHVTSTHFESPEMTQRVRHLHLPLFSLCWRVKAPRVWTPRRGTREASRPRSHFMMSCRRAQIELSGCVCVFFLPCPQDGKKCPWQRCFIVNCCKTNG